MIIIFSKVALILTLSIAAPFQGTEQPGFLSIIETADVMTSKPSATSHKDIDSWGAFSILYSYCPLSTLFSCRLDWNGSISLQLRWWVLQIDSYNYSIHFQACGIWVIVPIFIQH